MVRTPPRPPLGRLGSLGGRAARRRRLGARGLHWGSGVSVWSGGQSPCPPLTVSSWHSKTPAWAGCGVPVTPGPVPSHEDLGRRCSITPWAETCLPAIPRQAWGSEAAGCTRSRCGPCSPTREGTLRLESHTLGDCGEGGEGCKMSLGSKKHLYPGLFHTSLPQVPSD